MSLISTDKYKKLIKSERKEFFEDIYSYVYNVFEKNNYTTKDSQYFMDNASEFIENMRKECWNTYLILEKTFTNNLLNELIDNRSFNLISNNDAIKKFITEHTNHLYELILSNTQSRRSRAGKEFEIIIELLLIGAGISITAQGGIGKKAFESKGLNKQVDLVVPNVINYSINKRYTLLISAKTTLKERWQEVPEEMSRVGASEMFLATLDTKISKNVLTALYEANIQIVTTKQIKDTYYPKDNVVITFENLLMLCQNQQKFWDAYNYDNNDLSQIRNILTKQLNKHNCHQFVKNFFENELNKYNP